MPSNAPLSAAAALAVLQLELRNIERERADFDTQQKHAKDTASTLQQALEKANQANSLLVRDIKALESTLQQERQQYAELLVNQRASIELTMPKSTHHATPQAIPSSDRELISLFPSLNCSLIDVLRLLVADPSDSARSAVSTIVHALGLSPAHRSAICDRLSSSPNTTAIPLQDPSSPLVKAPSTTSSPANSNESHSPSVYSTPVDHMSFEEGISNDVTSFPVNVSSANSVSISSSDSSSGSETTSLASSSSQLDDVISLLDDLEISLDFEQDYSLFHCVSSLKGHLSPVRCVSFSPSSNVFLSCGEDGLIQIWSASVALPTSTNNFKPVAILRGSESPCLTATFANRKETRVISGSLDGSIHLYDLSNTLEPYPNSGDKLPYHQAKIFQHADAAWHVAVHPCHDDIVASCGSDGSVAIMDLSKLTGSSESVSDEATVDNVDQSEGISVVNIEPGLGCLSFMPFYIHLLSVACRNMVYLIDLSKLEVTYSVEIPVSSPDVTVTSLTAHPKTCLLAASLSDGSVALIDARGPKVVWVKQVHSVTCSDVGFLNANPSIIVSAGHDCTLRLTGLDSKMIGNVASHHVSSCDAGIWGISCHSSASLIVTAGNDCSVRIFSL
ncbi:hypothetical protein P9112_003522 [Eukaryota sp. TZLM1-RC]